MKFSIVWISFTIISIIGHQWDCDGLRILAIFPLNPRSHFIMSERLLRTLAEKGHQVDVYSHYPLKKPIPNYTDYDLSGTIPAVMNNVTYESVVNYRNGPIKMMKTFFYYTGEPVCKLVGLPVFQKLINNPPKDPPYDVVIVESAIALCHSIWGRHLNIPMIDVSVNVLGDWVYEAQGITVTPAVLPIMMEFYKDPDTFINRLSNYVAFTLTNVFVEYYTRGQNRVVEKYFGTGHPSVMELQKDAALRLVNHHYSLHGLRPFSPSVIPVSGIHIEDKKNETLPKKLQTWLDDSKHGCVYVSFGSMIRVETFPRHVIQAMYEAFERIAPVRVLWKVVNPDELPANLPRNVLTQKWFQQQLILKHKNVRAFVTHGGLMGTLESVYFGVPMLVVPVFADQSSNAIMYERKGIAVKVPLEELETKFGNALAELLSNTLYKKNIDRVSAEFRDSIVSPLDTAVYWIEYVARHGKNALRSPIVDMPWWQIKLFDVYAFLMGLAILALLIIYKGLRLIVRLITLIKRKLSAPKSKTN